MFLLSICPFLSFVFSCPALRYVLLLVWPSLRLRLLLLYFFLLCLFLSSTSRLHIAFLSPPVPACLTLLVCIICLAGSLLSVSFLLRVFDHIVLYLWGFFFPHFRILPFPISHIYLVWLWVSNQLYSLLSVFFLLLLRFFF